MYVFDTFVKITCWDCVALLLDALFHSISLHLHLCQFDSGFVSMPLEVNFYSFGLLSRSRFQNKCTHYLATQYKAEYRSVT